MTDLILGNPIGELSKKRARGLSFFGFKTAVIANRSLPEVFLPLQSLMPARLQQCSGLSRLRYRLPTILLTWKISLALYGIAQEVYLLNHAPSCDTRRMGKHKLAQVSEFSDQETEIGNSKIHT